MGIKPARFGFGTTIAIPQMHLRTVPLWIDSMDLVLTPVVAAAEYSFVYLLLGGGVGGAILIFLVAKMLGK
jgi:hypothetical protein